jgi:ribosomal-protein-alanine N-acetyltransferase
MQLTTSIPTCVLRPWNTGDKANLLRFANNRKIWRNLTHMFPSPYTEEDADHWLQIVTEFAPHTHFAIEVDGVAVGGIGAAPLEGIFASTSEFGYWLGEPYWGKGIVTAAARTMVAHTFAHLACERLEAAVFEWNPASMRVPEKAVFSQEGVLKRSAFKDGQFIARHMYAITKADA